MRLRQADMRSLEKFGSFDLILSLNDSVNYLLGESDLVSALRGMRSNLARDGLVLFDVNSRRVYDEVYSAAKEVEHQGSHWHWNGQGEIAPLIYEGRIEGDDIGVISNQERFRAVPEVRGAIAAAGLRYTWRSTGIPSRESPG